MRWLRMMMMAGATVLSAGVAQAAQADAFDLPVMLIVDAAATSYGMYEVRPSNHFKSGETIHLYAEPKNFKYKEVNGRFNFGMSADLLMIRKGDVVFGKENFLVADYLSHYANKEFMLNGKLTLTSVPPGDYTVELLLHDHISNESTKARLQFTVDGADAGN